MLFLRLTSVAYIRAACAADRLDGAYWLIGPGSAGLAQGCRCALSLQAWAGHIMAAARLHLVSLPMHGRFQLPKSGRWRRHRGSTKWNWTVAYAPLYPVFEDWA